MPTHLSLRPLARVPRVHMDCVRKKKNREGILSSIDTEALTAIKSDLGIDRNKLGPNYFTLLDEIGQKGRRQMGCYMGMLLGDILGAPIEFTPVQNRSNAINITLHSEPNLSGPSSDPFGTFISDKEGRVVYPEGVRNVFGLFPGQWTDDASMGACIADSLIVCDDGSLCDIALDDTGSADISTVWLPSFCGSDIRSRFWNWANNGYNNAFKNCKVHSPFQSVGLGGNISKSLAEIDNTRFREIPDFYISSSGDSGNGGLMRLAAVPVFYSSASVEMCMKYCGLSSQTTHPGIYATRAAEFMGFFIHKAINRPDDDESTSFEFAVQIAEQFSAEFCSPDSSNYMEGNNVIARLLASNEPIGSTEFGWNWRQQQLDLELCMHNRGSLYNGYPNQEGYYGSFCLDGLAVALNSFSHTNSFSASLVKCINYRGDADSTGAICGQLAGAFYGCHTIPSFLIHSSIKWDDSENIIRALMLTSWYRQQVASDRIQYLIEAEGGARGEGHFSSPHVDEVVDPPHNSDEKNNQHEGVKSINDRINHNFTVAYPEYPQKSLKGLAEIEKSHKNSSIAGVFKNIIDLFR